MSRKASCACLSVVSCWTGVHVSLGHFELVYEGSGTDFVCHLSVNLSSKESKSFLV